MRRRLFNIGAGGAVAVSLVLCMATVALWVRSWHTKDVISCYFARGAHLVASRHGRIGYQFIERRRGVDFRVSHSSGAADDFLFTGTVGDIEGVGSLGEEPTVTFWGAELTPWLGLYFIPHWMAAVAFGTLPICRMVAALRRHRRRLLPGLCPTCNYDCRATPLQCPECGTDLAPSHAATDDQREEPAGATR